MLVGARIGGQLDVSGATLVNPGATALNGDGLTVGPHLLCRDLSLKGWWICGVPTLAGSSTCPAPS